MMIIILCTPSSWIQHPSLMQLVLFYFRSPSSLLFDPFTHSCLSRLSRDTGFGNCCLSAVAAAGGIPNCITQSPSSSSCWSSSSFTTAENSIHSVIPFSLPLFTHFTYGSSSIQTWMWERDNRQDHRHPLDHHDHSFSAIRIFPLRHPLCLISIRDQTIRLHLQEIMLC